MSEKKCVCGHELESRGYQVLELHGESLLKDYMDVELLFCLQLISAGTVYCAQKSHCLPSLPEILKKEPVETGSFLLYFVE